MARLKPTPPAVLLAAASSAHADALQWSAQQLQIQWGAIVLTSRCYDHWETDYYETEMGGPLMKQFFVFQGLFDPGTLADRKLHSNQLEQTLADSGRYEQLRPVNIDPGYLMLGKLVLASTKDRAHRIYLRDGVYAEECLYYVGGWQSRPWTYPDYLRSDFQQFFDQGRQYLKQQIARRDCELRTEEGRRA
jgi:hypothetical protein